jgi:hypothetical protein
MSLSLDWVWLPVLVKVGKEGGILLFARVSLKLPRKKMNKFPMIELAIGF